MHKIHHALLLSLFVSSTIVSLFGQVQKACIQVVQPLPNGPSLATVVRGAAGFAAPDGAGRFDNGAFTLGTSGWTTTILPAAASGASVSVVQEEAQLIEGTAFLTTLSQRLTIPAGASAISFRLFDRPGFDRSATVGIPDAFEVSLLLDSGQSAVPTWNPAVSSCFNLQEDGTTFLAPGVTLQSGLVRIALTGVATSTELTIYVDLIGADGDTTSAFSVDDFRLHVPPQFIAPSPCAGRISHSAGQPLSLSLAAEDLDPLAAVGITATPSWPGTGWSLGTPPSGNPAQATWTWDQPTAGLHVITFIATDDDQETATCSVELLILQDAPVFLPPSPCGVLIPIAAGDPLSLEFRAADPNPQDVVTLRAITAPPWASFSSSPAAPGANAVGFLQGMPTQADVGRHDVVIQADDGAGQVVTCTVTIEVAPSTPPIIDSPFACGTRSMATAGATLRFTLTAQDQDPGDTVFLEAIELPPGAQFTILGPNPADPVSAEFLWTPSLQAIGLQRLRVRATDQRGLSTECALSFQVSECYLGVALAPSLVPSPVLGTDWLFIDPTRDPLFAVSLSELPHFAVPADPSLLGTILIFQVVMLNPVEFPTNPLQWTPGLRAVIGGSFLPYGQRNGMRIALAGPARLGQPLVVSFSIDGV